MIGEKNTKHNSMYLVSILVQSESMDKYLLVRRLPSERQAGQEAGVEPAAKLVQTLDIEISLGNIRDLALLTQDTGPGEAAV